MRILQPSRRGAKAKSGESRSGLSRAEGDYSEPSRESNHSSSQEEDLPKEYPPSSRRAKSTRQTDDYRGTELVNVKALEPEVDLPALPPGKKRRRSELQHSGATAISNSQAQEHLSLLADPAKKEFNELFARGIRLLAMREHSVKEITNKLFDKSDKSELVHAVVDELLQNKYLSDERFTESYIRARANRGFGPVKIRSELNSKGVGSGLIQEYLDESSGMWLDIASAQYTKKYGDAPVSDYNSWTKRARFMQSRGFTMEHIHVTLPSVDFD